MEQVQMMFKVFKWLIVILLISLALNFYQVYLSYRTPNTITASAEMHDNAQSNQSVRIK